MYRAERVCSAVLISSGDDVSFAMSNRSTFVLTVAGAGLFLSTLDSGVINVALRFLQQECQWCPSPVCDTSVRESIVFTINGRSVPPPRAEQGRSHDEDVAHIPCSRWFSHASVAGNDVRHCASPTGAGGRTITHCGPSKRWATTSLHAR